MESSYSQHEELPSDESVFRPNRATTVGEVSQWKTGEWTSSEKMRYAAFILYNKTSLTSKLNRRYINSNQNEQGFQADECVYWHQKPKPMQEPKPKNAETL